MSQVLLLQASLDSSLPMTNKPAGDGSSEYVPNPSTGVLVNDDSFPFFLQMMAIVIVPFGVSALTLIPQSAGELAEQLPTRDKLKRLDIVGCFMMLVSIILLILGITLGASYGWKKPGFLVPFLLCWPIFVAFFIYEARLSEGYALIPPSFWKIPNMTLLIVFALGIYPWWCVSQFFVIRTAQS